MKETNALVAREGLARKIWQAHPAKGKPVFPTVKIQYK